VILLYPLLLIVAGIQLRRRLVRGGRFGWQAAAAWSVASVLFVFSLLTGLSIGLLLLPLVVLSFGFALVLVRQPPNSSV